MRFVFNGELELVVDYFHEDIVGNYLIAGKDYTENFPDLTNMLGLKAFDKVEVFCGDTEMMLNGNYNTIANLSSDFNGEILTVSLALENGVV